MSGGVIPADCETSRNTTSVVVSAGDGDATKGVYLEERVWSSAPQPNPTVPIASIRENALREMFLHTIFASSVDGLRLPRYEAARLTQ